MNLREAVTYRNLKADLNRKGWVDLAYKVNFRGSPELRDIPDEAFPKTVLIIPDGQRRFGDDARISTPHAYKLGADNLILQLKALSSADVPIHTAIAWGFSADNWSRPPQQIDGLMTLMNNTIPEISQHLDKIGGRFVHLGRRNIREDKAELFKDYPVLIENMHDLERKTRKNKGKVIAVAIDFGGFDQDIRSHQAALDAGTMLRPEDPAEVLPENIWEWRDGGGLVHTADLGIRTGEKVLVQKGVGMFHSSDIGWPNGKGTYWVTYEKRFPQLTLQDTALAIREYALEEKRQGK